MFLFGFVFLFFVIVQILGHASSSSVAKPTLWFGDLLGYYHLTGHADEDADEDGDEDDDQVESAYAYAYVYAGILTSHWSC